MRGISLNRYFSLTKRYFSSNMKAIVMNEFGDVNVLKVQNVKRPDVEKGTCVIQLHACGVNPVCTLKIGRLMQYLVG